MLDKDVLKETKLIFADQDENIWLAMVAMLLPKGTTYVDALARLCNWHKIACNLVNKTISHLLSVSDKEFRDVIVDWLYALTSTVEDTEKEKH